MKYESKVPGSISSFKNMHKRDKPTYSTMRKSYLEQEANCFSKEVEDRQALIEAERGTEKEAANNAKAAENLRKLFGL